MTSISNTSSSVRFAMQATTQAKSAVRGGTNSSSFAKKLDSQSTTQASQRGEDPGMKVKKRKVAPQFQNNEMEIEARMLEQQRQAQSTAKQGTQPTPSTSSQPRSVEI